MLEVAVYDPPCQKAQGVGARAVRAVVGEAPPARCAMGCPHRGDGGPEFRAAGTVHGFFVGQSVFAGSCAGEETAVGGCYAVEFCGHRFFFFCVGWSRSRDYALMHYLEPWRVVGLGIYITQCVHGRYQRNVFGLKIIPASPPPSHPSILISRTVQIAAYRGIQRFDSCRPCAGAWQATTTPIGSDVLKRKPLNHHFNLTLSTYRICHPQSRDYKGTNECRIDA